MPAEHVSSSRLPVKQHQCQQGSTHSIPDRWRRGRCTIHLLLASTLPLPHSSDVWKIRLFIVSHPVAFEGRLTHRLLRAPSLRNLSSLSTTWAPFHTSSTPFISDQIKERRQSLAGLYRAFPGSCSTWDVLEAIADLTFRATG